MSKGSKPRPIKDKEKFSANWDSIFKKAAAEATAKDYKDCREIISKASK